MADDRVRIFVSQQDFETRINDIGTKMAALQDVINKYNNAKANLSQFIEEGDSSYEDMVARIDVNVSAAKKAYTALQEVKAELERTVQQMEGMGQQIKETISSGTEAAKSTVEAAIKVSSVL